MPDPAWQMAGIETPRAVADYFHGERKCAGSNGKWSPKFSQARAIKLKLTGEVDLDMERVRAVRAARPDVWLGVDANQGYVRVRWSASCPF